PRRERDRGPSSRIGRQPGAGGPRATTPRARLGGDAHGRGHPRGSRDARPGRAPARPRRGHNGAAAMTPAVRALIALLSFVVLWAGWLFWFLAYRSAARRAREAEEILTSLAVKIAAGDVAGCVPIG